MDREPDRFTYIPQYPDVPGFRGAVGGPSETAARIIAPRAKNLRAAVLEKIAQAGARGMTADEVAAILNRSVLSVRPRVAELNASHEIVETGERRTNGSGMTANVWRAAASLPGKETGMASLMEDALLAQLQQAEKKRRKPFSIAELIQTARQLME